MSRNSRSGFLVVSLFALLPATLFSQSFQASVSGIVTDQSGAVVPSVKVTVTDSRARSFVHHHGQSGWGLQHQ